MGPALRIVGDVLGAGGAVVLTAAVGTVTVNVVRRDGWGLPALMGGGLVCAGVLATMIASAVGA